MTDREFDNLMKEALCSDNVPQQLNNSLLLTLEKKRKQKGKVLNFVKTCSSCAAVFICAVAVISYYNSNISHRAENNTPEVKNTAIQKDVDIKEEEVLPETNTQSKKSDTPAPVTSNKVRSIEEDSTPQKAAVPAAEVAEEVVTAQEEAVLPDVLQEDSTPFMVRRGMPASLGDLFSEGYDYISVISERINAQIAIMDFPEAIKFSQITGNESFSLNEENMLTIEFKAGEIASHEHGDLFFTVGTVQNGILE